MNTNIMFNSYDFGTIVGLIIGFYFGRHFPHYNVFYSLLAIFMGWAAGGIFGMILIKLID